MSRALLVVLLAGCVSIPPTVVPRTRVELATLQQHKDDLGSVVSAELAAGHNARAFHALEVAKTRPLSTMQLGNRYTVARSDLRPVFAQLYSTPGTGEHRGFNLVAGAALTSEQQQKLADEQFWQSYETMDKYQSSSTGTFSGEGAITAFEDARLVFPTTSAVASFFVHDDRVYLFWLRRGSLHVYPLQVSASVMRTEAAALLAALRLPPDRRTTRWEPHATALYAGLLGPVAPQLRSHKITTIYISPDQFIANIPFDVLIDHAAKDALLIDLVRTTRIPSVSFHRNLLYRMTSQDDAPRILAIGNPTYPPNVPALPSTEREATVVSEIFDDQTLLVGAAATEARIRELAPKANVLHFATHGVLLGAAVPGASSLLVTADGSDDGFLSANEISTLDLTKTQLAVLSACETSVGDDRGGALDLASLTGAFLVAGVPTVIGTLWQVDDVSTSMLMLEIYKRLHRVGSGVALREAQLALRQTRYADPYYWGGFVLYGWGQ